MKYRSLAFKQSFFVLTSVIFIFAVIFVYQYESFKEIAVKDIKANARTLTVSSANRINAVFNSAATVADSVAIFLNCDTLTEEQLHNLQRSIVENNDSIYGCSVSFAPGKFEGRNEYAPYYCEDGKGGLLYKNLVGENYLKQPWYNIAFKKERGSWTEPYYDKGGGNTLMTTYSTPFFSSREKQEIVGVITVDISLSWLDDLMAEMSIFDIGYGFMTSGDGRIISMHPAFPWHLRDHIILTGNEVKNKEKFFQVISEEHLGWVYYLPLDFNDWSLAIFFPEGTLFAEVLKMYRDAIIMGLVGCVLLLFVVVFVSSAVARPLKVFASAAEKIGDGDFNASLPKIMSKDELGKLSQAFSHMQVQLAEYIKNLKETTIAKEKMEGDLRVAHDIQMSIIPKTFPPFPHRSEFDIYGTLESAKAVGGDLYDFFFVDDDHLCFVIGDVSGKGVPASLFMAVTRTLLRDKMSHGVSSAEVISDINESLCADNKTIMFVSFFLAILNVKTGEVQYSNAGHNPPFIVRASGRTEELDACHGMPLGIRIKPYGYNTVTLNPGDTIALYTDGVTEAHNANKDMFGEEVLLKVIQHNRHYDPEGIVGSVVHELKDFVGNVPPFDDITFLVLKFYG